MTEIRLDPAGTDGQRPGLIETMASEAGDVRHLEAHLDRLLASADALGIPADRERIRRAVLDAASGIADDSAVLRIELSATGLLGLSRRPLPEPDTAPVRLLVDTVRQDPDHPTIRHKTTRREHYRLALERGRSIDPTVDDVVLRGRDGRVTETTIAALLVRIGGRWWTPPLEDGCLPGVARRLALDAGEISARPITAEMLRSAEQVALLSSVRGHRAAILLDPAEHGTSG